MRWRKKRVKSVSVIGGADGPTSIFLVGRWKKQGLMRRLKSFRYKRKKEKIEKEIREGFHDLKEVVLYIQNTYGAREIAKDSHNYLEQRKCLKESLIIKHKPELLGDKADIPFPDEQDEESIKEFFNQIEERSRIAENIPDDMIPMDLHLYEIVIPDAGRMEVEIDTVWNIFGCSYSGKNMKLLKEISKELYKYYGVTKEDIDNRSERYLKLAAALAN